MLWLHWREALLAACQALKQGWHPATSLQSRRGQADKRNKFIQVHSNAVDDKTAKMPPRKGEYLQEHSQQPLKTHHEEQFLPFTGIQTAPMGTQAKESCIIISLICTIPAQVRFMPLEAAEQLLPPPGMCHWTCSPLTTHFWSNFSSLWPHRASVQAYTTSVKCNWISPSEGQPSSHVPI